MQRFVDVGQQEPTENAELLFLLLTEMTSSKSLTASAMKESLGISATLTGFPMKRLPQETCKANVPVLPDFHAAFYILLRSFTSF